MAVCLRKSEQKRYCERASRQGVYRWRIGIGCYAKSRQHSIARAILEETSEKCHRAELPMQQIEGAMIK